MAKEELEKEANDYVTNTNTGVCEIEGIETFICDNEEMAVKYVREHTGFNVKEPLGKIAVRTYLAGAASREKQIEELEKENAELKKVAEFQQSSNMSRHFENKKLKEVLAVGSTFNKALNSMNKSLEEERDKYRNMVFDKNDKLTKAKELLAKWVELFKPKGGNIPPTPIQVDTEQFLSGVEK